MNNRSMGKLPFEVVYTHLPRLTLDLANFPSFVDVSSVVEAVVDQILKLHQEVKDHLEAANNAYKPAADSKKKLGSRNVSNWLNNYCSLEVLWFHLSKHSASPVAVLLVFPFHSSQSLLWAICQLTLGSF